MSDIARYQNRNDGRASETEHPATAGEDSADDISMKNEGGEGDVLVDYMSHLDRDPAQSLSIIIQQDDAEDVNEEAGETGVFVQDTEFDSQAVLSEIIPSDVEDMSARHVFNVDGDGQEKVGDSRMAKVLSYEMGEETEELHLLEVESVNTDDDAIDADGSSAGGNEAVDCGRIDLICGSCSEHFTSLSSLQQHLEDYHKLSLEYTKRTNIEVLQDSDEEIVVDDDPNLKNSNQTNESVDDVEENLEDDKTCKICFKSFKSSRILYRHSKICRKEPTSPKIKQQPLVNSLGDSPHLSMPLACDMCGKKFSQSKSLQRHLRTQHGLKSNHTTLIRSNDASSLGGRRGEKKQNASNKTKNSKIYLKVALGKKFSFKEKHSSDVENIDQSDSEGETSDGPDLKACDDRGKVLANHASLLERMDRAHGKIKKEKSCDDDTESDLSNQFLVQQFERLSEGEAGDGENFEIKDPLDGDMFEITLKKEDLGHGSTVVVITRGDGKDGQQSESRGRKPSPLTSNRSRHQCTQCYKALSSRHSLMEHMRTHTGERPFVCQDCNRAFTTPRNLKKHHQSVHSGLRPFKCGDCDKTFSLKSSLKAHAYFHTGDFKYRCSSCGKGFQTPAAVKRHERIHTDERPYACDQCDKRFNDTSALNKHLFYHTGLKPHVCDECGSAFATASTLRAHNLVHSGVSTFLCQQCGKYFRTNSSLQRHQRIHDGKKPFVCDLCPKDFMERWQLVSHRRGHTGEKPYECSQCKKRFVSNRKLTRHLHIHNPLHLCNVCGKSFTTSSFLKIHMYKHTGEHPHHCDQCSKKFSTQALLRRHLLTHTGIKPFICDTCGKCFTTMVALRNHTTLHTGIRPHVCETCGKGFPSATSLKIHMQFHSTEKPFECEECGKRFHRVYELNHHRIIHSTVKPYKCDICDKAYHHKSGLDAHKNTHTEEKWYRCDECDKSFLREATLRKHKKIHAVPKPHVCQECDRGFSRKEHLKRHELTHIGKHEALTDDPVLDQAIELEQECIEEEDCLIVLEEPQTPIVAEHVEMVHSS